MTVYNCAFSAEEVLFEKLNWGLFENNSHNLPGEKTRNISVMQTHNWAQI
jgi:hypothetical protein